MSAKLMYFIFFLITFTSIKSFHSNYKQTGHKDHFHLHSKHSKFYNHNHRNHHHENIYSKEEALRQHKMFLNYIKKFKLPNCEEYEKYLEMNPIKYQKLCMSGKMKELKSSTNVLEETHTRLIRYLAQIGSGGEALIQMNSLEEISSCRDYLNYFFNFRSRNSDIEGMKDYEDFPMFFEDSIKKLMTDFFDVYVFLKTVDRSVRFRNLQLKKTYFNFFKEISHNLSHLSKKIKQCDQYEDFLNLVEEIFEYLAMSCQYREYFIQDLKSQIQF